MIKEYLANTLSATFVEQGEADLRIYAQVNTSKKGDHPNEWGMYITFADATFNVVSGRSGGEIYSTSLTKIQGSDFNSNEGSAKHALFKISGQIQKEMLPKVIESLNSN